MTPDHYYQVLFWFLMDCPLCLSDSHGLAHTVLLGVGVVCELSAKAWEMFRVGNTEASVPLEAGLVLE